MKNNTRRPYELINEIVEEFDYKKVHRCMVALDWVWAASPMYSWTRIAETRVPELSTLQTATTVWLYETVDKALANEKPDHEEHMSTGGFRILVEKENNEITYINLSFVVTDWSAFDEFQ